MLIPQSPATLLTVPGYQVREQLYFDLGSRQQDEEITFPVEGVDGGSISMLAVCVGKL